MDIPTGKYFLQCSDCVFLKVDHSVQGGVKREQVLWDFISASAVDTNHRCFRSSSCKLTWLVTIVIKLIPPNLGDLFLDSLLCLVVYLGTDTILFSYYSFIVAVDFMVIKVWLLFQVTFQTWYMVSFPPRLVFHQASLAQIARPCCGVAMVRLRSRVFFFTTELWEHEMHLP